MQWMDTLIEFGEERVFCDDRNIAVDLRTYVTLFYQIKAQFLSVLCRQTGGGGK